MTFQYLEKGKKSVKIVKQCAVRQLVNHNWGPQEN